MAIDISETDLLLECLLSVCRHHGNSTTREALVAGLPFEGRLTPSLFERAAKRANMVSKIIRKPLESLHNALLPAVLLLDDDQACLLMGWSADNELAKVIYPDLSEVEIEVPAMELYDRYSGVAILTRPRFNFDARAPEIRHQKTGHWFWGALKENIPLYRDVLLAAFLINLFALAMPLFTMNVYNRVVPNNAFETLWMMAIGVGIILIGDLLLKSMRGYFLDLASRRVDINLSALIMARVLGIRMEYRPLSAGSFAANLKSFETVRDFITSASITTLIDLPFSIIFMVVIWWIAPNVLIPLLIGILVVVIYALTTQKKMQELAETTHRASALRNATLIESLVGLDTLKAMGAESIMQRRWEKSAAFLARVSVQLKLLSTSNVNVAMWTQQLVSVAVIIVGVYTITEGELSMGGLIAVNMLANRTMAPIGQVAGLLTQFHIAASSLLSLNAIMEQPVERPQGANFVSRETFKGDIEFRDVSFAYPEQGVEALRNVSFKLKQGESVAILGRIGSGKSTLQKLTLGLFAPTEGSILIDGMDIRQLDPAELRQHVGYVPQDVTLFYGSLRENLVLAHQQANDKAVIKAADFANLTEFVNTHPHGFDMLIGERGESLSGGQRKAVSVARAVIHEPPILLFDEPTGSMDHSSEAWIKTKLKDFMQGRTLMLVTHRTPLMDLVDRIIVMDRGQIVADGPRDKVVEALKQGKIGKAS
jgi:ATP-binding cassette subfamily C protein LapB